MRGIIVSSLSQIDDMCFKVIKHKYQTSDDKPAFAAVFKKSIVKQGKGQGSQKEKVAKKDDDDFIEELHSTLILDSFKRASKVAGLTEGDLGADDQQTLQNLPETVRKRNRLAHWKHLEETDTQITLGEGDANYIFDQEEAARMRKNINEAGVVLTKYLEAISSKTANA